MQERLKVYEEKMNKSYDALLNEYTSIRAGRANPHVLDKIKVDYYGAPTPLQQVANISIDIQKMRDIPHFFMFIIPDGNKQPALLRLPISYVTYRQKSQSYVLSYNP